MHGGVRGDRASPSPARWPTTLTLPARLLHVLPDDADLTAAALLEPAACIAAAALKANAVPGERVAVVGTGRSACSPFSS